jgi:hypothetical protein
VYPPGCQLTRNASRGYSGIVPPRRRLHWGRACVSGPARPCICGRCSGSLQTCKLIGGWRAQAGLIVELFRPAGGGVRRATVRLASGQTVKAPWAALEPA